MGCFIQLASRTGIPSTELVFIRAAFQGTFVVLAMFVYREENNAYLPVSTTDPTTTATSAATTISLINPSVQPNRHCRRMIQVPLGNASTRSIIIPLGVASGFAFVLYFFTISVLPLGDAIALLSLHPIATIFAAAAMLGEPVRRVHVIASTITVIGTFLIARPAFLFGKQQGMPHSDSYNPFGYVTAAMGTCLSAVVFILMRKAGDSGAHTLQLLFSWACFGLFFSVVLGNVLPVGQGSWDLPSSTLAWVYTLGCCMLGSVGHFLLNFAARHSNPGLASIVRSSGIIWAYILQICFFHQIPTLLTCAGVLLVSSSLVIVSVQQYSDSKTSEEDGILDSITEDDSDSSVEEQNLYTLVEDDTQNESRSPTSDVRSFLVTFFSNARE